MTIFILLFSAGWTALLVALLHIKKITGPIFAALMGLLVIFAFALISLDKIYYLHSEQDGHFEARLKLYDEQLAHKFDVFKQLTNIQLETTLQVLAQNTAQDNEKNIKQKLMWRDDLIASLSDINADKTLIEKVEKQINSAVHSYLMERLNKQFIQSLGHRVYGDFIRQRPRDEWTDELFVNELEPFLKKQGLLKDDIAYAIERIKVFDERAVLLSSEPETVDDVEETEAKGSD